MAGSRIRPAALLVLLMLSASIVSAQCLSQATITANTPVTLSVCAAADVTSIQARIDDQVIHDGPVTAAGIDAASGATLFPLPPVTLSAGSHTLSAAARNTFGVSPVFVASLTASTQTPTPDPIPIPTPTPGPCVPVLTPSGNVTASAAGVTGSIDVTVEVLCAWTAASGAAWLHVMPTSGTGPATLNYIVDTNTGEAREQDIGIGGATFHVHQLAGTSTPTPEPTPTPIPTPPPATCTYVLSQLPQAFGRSGGSVFFGLATQPGCPWAVTDDASWLEESPTKGSGSASIRLSASKLGGNPNTLRTGHVAIAGQVFLVQQTGR